MRNKEEREADRERKNQTFTQFTILCEGTEGGDRDHRDKEQGL